MAIKHYGDTFTEGRNASSATGDIETLDYGVDSDLFPGAPLWLVLAVTTAMTGGGTVTVKLQQSSSETSGYTDIPNASLKTDANSAVKFYSIGLPTGVTKRFIKAHGTKTGTVSAGKFSLYLTPMQPSSRSDFKLVQ